MAVRSVPPTDRYEASGNATSRRERSFAALYEQARRAAANDDAEKRDAAIEADKEQNRRYIETLHERVDTLRGEILVRVIQAGQADTRETARATNDISRLSNRLDGLRKKLHSEEARLSGKLIDVNI